MNMLSGSRSDKNLKTMKRIKTAEKQKNKDDNYIVNFSQTDKAVTRHCARGCPACTSK